MLHKIDRRVSTAIQDMVNQITSTKEFRKSKFLERADYEEWKKQYTLDAIMGQRYGQSFCNHFGITDHILYFQPELNEAERHIEEFYVK